MALDEETAWVVWPEYFDANRSRSQGRKVSKKFAVSNPTTEAIAKVLIHMELDFRIEEDKSYPGNWHHHKGRILVEDSIPKTELIQEIAEKLARD
jgi:signal recognition particle subunit SRP19